MEPTYLADYLHLAFRLGHLSASLGEYGQDRPDSIQDDIDELGGDMEVLGLPQSRAFIISFLEQVGDLTQSPDVVDILADEAEANLERVLETIRTEVEELRKNPGSLPASVRDTLTPRQLDALPSHAREGYNEAKVALLAETWTLAGTSACTAVEVTFRELYSCITRSPAQGTWEDLENDLRKHHRRIANYHNGYFTNLLKDIRINYRNPLVHGTLRLFGESDGVAVFYFCTEALRRMAEAILVLTAHGKCVSETV